MSIGERAEAIGLYRELSAQNDASAFFQIYDEYKSYERSDVTKPQIVKRAEAEQALRKAAELGHAYATLMLAVLLDRGDTVKRDPAQAIYWAERAGANLAENMQPIDMQVLLGRLLVKSSNADDKARGVALLERAGQRGRGDAKAYLATAIRASDPVRARALLEEGLRGYAGAVIPPLADMLIKGEGGKADPKRAVSLLTGRVASDVPAVMGARAQLLLDGKLVPRDLQQGVRFFSIWARWDYDARLQLMRLLAANPELTISYPQGILYDATEAVELDEPGAAAALIELKLSQSAQFRDKPGGCALAERAAKGGDETAARLLRGCAN
jgi:TPR repeat protein